MSTEFRFRIAFPCSDFRSSIEAGELSVHDGASETDLEFVLRAFDSALPYLASIGSEAQWGTIPFSQRPQTVQSWSEYIAESNRIHKKDSSTESTNSTIEDVESWKQMVILEIRPQESSEWRRVAAMGISVEVPDYVTPDLLAQEIRQEAKFIYLNYLIADRRAVVLARNTAQKLVKEHAIPEAKRIGKHTIYVDCWRGNQGGLVK